VNLLLSVPTGVLVDERVVKVVAEADFGSFAMLPRHADVVALLVPGLLAYHTEDGEEVFVAVDHGVMVKTGAQVRAACQRAVVAGALGNAEAVMRERFAQRSEQQKRVRSALIQLESQVLQNVAELRR